jgi:tRNA 5-methylaminomethyl-2-thiouridine biosynthesis bifunctional protein
MHVIGATFDMVKDAIPAPAQSAAPEDDDRNVAQLDARFPGLFNGQRPAQGRASLRAMTTDHLPLVGPVPVYRRFLEDFAGLRHGLPPGSYPKPAYWPGLWVAAGFGARGLVTAPLAGELLACRISGVPAPVTDDTAAGLHPARFLVRQLKQRKI